MSKEKAENEKKTKKMFGKEYRFIEQSAKVNDKGETIVSSVWECVETGKRASSHTNKTALERAINNARNNVIAKLQEENKELKKEIEKIKEILDFHELRGYQEYNGEL